MPQAVSRKQFRLMQAILHGKADSSKSGRGTPPKSVAAKYSSPGKDAPEQHGENRGGTWGEKHHAKAKEKVKEARKDRKKSKKDLKKTFEDFYKSDDRKAAAVIVLDDDGKILFGKHPEGLAIPGGHMDDGDLGSFEIAALRELKEEAGIIGRNPQKIWEGKDGKTDAVVFLIESWTGELKHGDDLGPLKWLDPKDIEWKSIRPCCRASLKSFVEQKLGKSLHGMLLLENYEKLEKNIIRQRGDAVFEVTHGDALRLVGNGMFRKLREEVKDMGDEEFKDIHIDTNVISIRKHMNDVYSGRVSDGHKVVYQFTHKSLPELTAALMSVFEWYLPEDEEVLNYVSDDALDDDVIHGGVQTLIDNYKRHNIGNIYEEMETIREQIRNGVAIDLQQVEARIMKLFDKLEDVVHNITDKHNQLANSAGTEIDELERKLLTLQAKIDDMGKVPETITAISSTKSNPARIHDENYPYLPRPQVQISPNGAIRITFSSDWTDLEKQNFLHDMRAKTVKREKSNG